jgi:glycosyltransferase involved in cell wall biosynthesis
MVLLSGVFSKLIFKSYFIYDAHELESNKAGQSHALSLATIIIEKIAWPYVDHFISVSQSIINWYQEKFSIKPHTLILNSPVVDFKAPRIDIEFNQYLRKKYNIPVNELVYIYVGELAKGRGIDLFLSVFSSDEVSSSIVFLGNGQMESEILKYAGYTKKIHHHAAVPHSEVVRITNTADIGLCMIEPVSLSDYYALPNKLFEYLDAGLHIICSDMPEISKIIREYDLGIVTELSESKLKNVILQYESIKPPRNNIFIEELTWNYQKKKLIDLYISAQNTRLNII